MSPEDINEKEKIVHIEDEALGRFWRAGREIAEIVKAKDYDKALEMVKNLKDAYPNLGDEIKQDWQTSILSLPPELRGNLSTLDYWLDILATEFIDLKRYDDAREVALLIQSSIYSKEKILENIELEKNKW
ncbi:hypothetical protein IPF86_04020 [Candidatus Nomurabacteria bacterium]|jgi:hypothetical protein|nr:MAG: hypothetical protein IPF86_04020 [Candidatus Nomurabacteria bacterium]